MKKTIVIIGIVLIGIILSGCTAKMEPEVSKDLTVIIVLGDNQVTVEAASFRRVSSSWAIVTAKDGTTYRTNEKNVLVVERDKTDE